LDTYINNVYGKNALENLFKHESSEAVIKKTLMKWLNEYREYENK